MNGEATPTGLDVDWWGSGASHWYLDPPLDEHDHIVICDRTELLRDPGPVLAAIGVGDIPTHIPTFVEVFPARADGSLDAPSMSALRKPTSLRRRDDGIDITQILAALGYQENP